jgi:hypothetical protein
MTLLHYRRLIEQGLATRTSRRCSTFEDALFAAAADKKQRLLRPAVAASDTRGPSSTLFLPDSANRARCSPSC